LPLILFIGVLVILSRGLKLHPNEVPSPLVNKAGPALDLPLLFNPTLRLTDKDLQKHVTLLNVWASWCSACAAEHEILLQLAMQENLIIDGLDYKDDPAAAKKVLMQSGNPYQKVAMDQTGDVAINWGVYGTPETFILDKNGIIRYN
jgi:cytochrome c biogenesis protein CcmG/thiol:disulfide interchange protein DsbE